MAKTREKGRSRIDQLPRQAFASQLGQTQLGQLDTTAKGVGLSVEFACWMMGFPLVEWLACMPSVTQSSRKSARK
jgi:hypothetical protein